MKVRYNMKVGFSVTAHQSEQFRPKGHEYIDNYLKTLWKAAKFPYKVYVIDNQSDEPLNLEGDDIQYTRIDNQFDNGITGAWNMGIDQAYKDGCDIICQTNDDIVFNETINSFVDFIVNHDDMKDQTLYGPLTNGIVGFSRQLEQQPTGKIFQLNGIGHNTLNGFFFGFTRKFYERFRHSETELFASKHEHDGGDGKWGGQEGEFYRFRDSGAYFYVIGTSWIYHHKERGYRATRNADREKRNEV